MRDFHKYTMTSRAARRQRWLLSWPVGLLLATAVLGLVMRVGVVPISTQLLGYNTGSEASAAEASGAGWVRDVLGRSREGYGGPLNVLVLGVDKRPSDSRAPQVIGSRSDTIMLVRIHPRSGEVGLLSIPRDLLVEVEPGLEDRINTAYSYGGIDQTREVVKRVTGIPIDGYAIVDFEGFSNTIDAMGGVEVDVEDEIPPKYEIEDGLQTLNGEQALYYARWRGTSRGDLDRIEHQQQLVAALRSKAFNWDTVTKLPEIMNVIEDNVETDLDFQEALSLGRILISNGRNARMTSVQLEGTPEVLPSGAQVLIPRTAANEAILEEFRN